MIRIQSSASIGKDGIKCCVYGASGTGKTPLMASAPNVIILSMERGLLSIRTRNPPVPYIEINNWRELQDARRWINESRESKQFYTIGLDSLSEASELNLIDERPKHKDRRQAYDAVQTNTLELVRWFRDLPGRTVVLNCKEQYDKDAAGTLLYQPMLPGWNLPNQIPYFFDETFRMIEGVGPDGKKWRGVRTQSTMNEKARDRSGTLDEIEYPDLTNIFKKILGIGA